MDQIASNSDDLQSLKGTEQEWYEKTAKYPSLKKLSEQGSNTESQEERADRVLRFIKSHQDLETMKDKPSRVLEAIDEFASQHEFFPVIGSEKGGIISNLLLENKPRVLVVCSNRDVGYSAILFGEQMRAHATDARPVQIWNIEKDEKFATVATDLVSLAGLQDYVTAVSGAASEVLRKLYEEKKLEHIDFLFLDQAQDLYTQDLKVAMEELKLLRTNACIVADNVLRPGAPEYREYVRSHKGLRSRGLKGKIMPGEFEDEIEISYVLPQDDGEERDPNANPEGSIV